MFRFQAGIYDNIPFLDTNKAGFVKTVNRNFARLKNHV